MSPGGTNERTFAGARPGSDTPDDTPDEDEPLSGTPYGLIRPLGEGGMGEVFEAEHLALGHHVAVKLLRAEHYARFELKDRMRLEAQACARIRHDNLVQVNDCGETLDGRVFVVMELLRGRTLGAEIASRGALPPAEAIDIAAQALAGIAAAHDAGVVHRDLKPDNLFLCDRAGEPRRVKVLDFGIAKIVDAGRSPETPAPLAQPTAEGLTVGTPRYASPEQSRAERDIDARSDLYSIGLVLHTMLTGRPPFADKIGHAELARAHATETLPPPSASAPHPVTPELDRIVGKALAKRREDRYPSAHAFRAELRRIVGQPTAVGPAMPVAATVALGPTMAALVHEPADTTARLPAQPTSSRRSTRPSRQNGAVVPVLVCAGIVIGGVAVAVLLRVLGVW